MIFSFKEPPIIISVGGSLIYPNGGIDTEFLSNLNKLIRKQVSKGKRFFLVAGGGKIARHYQEAGKKVIGNILNEDLDWLGIHATRFNAHLLRTIFQDISYPVIIKDYGHKIFNLKYPVVIGAGWKPGWSTDYDAVILARDYGANLIINLSNIDGVYDKDPKKYKDAKFIKKITWEEMEKITGTKWTPGFNAPFDPVATPLAKKLGLTVVVVNGHNFDNLEKIIEGESFIGTVITPLDINSSFYDKDYYFGKKGGHKIKYTGSFLSNFFHNFKDLVRALTIKIQFNPKRVLDVGCGLGRLVYWLRLLGVDAYGIDFSENAYLLVSKKIKKFIQVADAKKIPYKDNSFDLVLSIDLLQHVDRDNLKSVIKETIRVSNKYILHKIYTKENIWFKLTHRYDPSNVSLFYKKYWDKVFQSFNNIIQIRNIFRLPDFIETKYLLKKK